MSQETPQQHTISEQRPVRILHLSDFHFDAAKAWDADPVLQGLSDAIQQFVADDLAPDAVAITGDIAHKGRAADYEQAAKWISQGLLAKLPSGFPRNHLLLVPGNHDVDRATVKTMVQSAQNTLLEKRDQDTIAAVLDDADERELLLKRHAGYLKFANRYCKAKQRLKVPWWSRVLRFDDVPVHFVGLCSSWMSWSDNDHGRLLVGEYQANPLLHAEDHAALRVVLMHHPWDYMAEFDSRVIEPSVHRRADLLLRGHLHRERARLIRDPDDVCLELAAGSVYDGGQYANAFQLIEIFPAAKTVLVHYRVWHKGRWVPDRNAYQAAENGIARFDLQPSPGSPEPSPRAVRVDTRAYLTVLRDRTSMIDIRGLQIGTGRATSFPIDELYIPLTTTVAEAASGAGRGSRRGKRTASEAADVEPSAAERVELHQALKHPRLVIIGHPGTGKTTFLQRIASVTCRTLLGDDREASRRELGIERPALPILIRIADLVKHVATSRERKTGPLGTNTAAWLVHHLTSVSTESHWGLDEKYFEAQLESGEAIVMFDGLDEAPSLDDRRAVLKLIENIVSAFGKCRFVLTSRPGAYQDDTVLSDFVQVRIDPLEDETVRWFLGRWCQALFAEQPSRCDEHLRELLRALESRPEMRRLARNPVMLTALAVVHWNEKRLPEQRADLYESIITWLARSREQRAGRATSERCIGLLQNLALAMHDDPRGRQVQVARYAAAQVLAPSLRDVPADQQHAAAQQFLIEEELDSGILVSVGDDVRFWHLTFQEYLAARALAACSDDEQRKRLFAQPKLYQDQWREVALLLAGVLCHQGFERVDRMFGAILEQMGPQPSLADQARCAGLLGAAVRDLKPANYQPGDPRYHRTLQAVLGLFDAERAGEVPIKEAVEAADVLGQAGDPRFEPEQRENNWITIPAGEFWMGAQKKSEKQRNYDVAADVLATESPVHCVWLDEFQIAKYPVTVGEYREFLKAGGYREEQFWEAGGFGQFEHPGEWEEQLQYPTRPVIEVSWYEAAAYAAWKGCQLPTEAQWERAARGGDARRYPWGDQDPDDRRMNYKSNIGHPTPVGLYPGGNTPDGICDLAGNVWEWCWDWHGEYPEDRQENPQGPPAGSSRVLRGGSWGGHRRRPLSFCVPHRLPSVGPRPRHRFSVVVFVFVVASQSSSGLTISAALFSDL